MSKSWTDKDLGKEVTAFTEDFSPNRQSWKLFSGQFWRLLLTLLFLGLFILTLILWEQRGNVSHDSKIWFNTITTILNLALGLNFLEVFKDMSKVLRWRVLSHRPFSVREADLIMGAESLTKLTNLMWESRRKPYILLICFGWLAFNLLAQASIAMLSLNYSMDSGSTSEDAYAIPGMPDVAKLDCFYLQGNCPQAPGIQMVNANSYGSLQQVQPCCFYNDTEDILKQNQSCTTYCRSDSQEFAYRFKEFNPLDTTLSYPFLTDRTVRASVGQCYQYTIDGNTSTFTSDSDGQNNVEVFAFTNGSYTGYLPIPRSDGAFNSTTYVYNGTDTPESEAQLSCGPRCMKMYAFRLGEPGINPATNMFECEISVSDVFNATEDFHHISDGTARIAVASIGLTGRFTHDTSGNLIWNQYSLYTWGSYWETYQKSANEVGQNMAKFALGAIAGLGNLNPRVPRQGTLPVLGYKTSVNWRYAIALIACVGAVHFMLVLFIVWVSRPVVLVDDSNLAVARILYGLIKRVDGRGSLLDGKQLAEAIENASSDQVKVVYGVNTDGNTTGRHRVELDEGVSVRGRLPKRSFPVGAYD